MQACPQLSREIHFLLQPPSGENMEKSSGFDTSIGVSLCRGQHSARAWPVLPSFSRMVITLSHIGAERAVCVLPMMYIPWRARLSKTLMRFEVLRNPHFLSSLLRTNEITITFASSPWKLSTLAILKASSNVALRMLPLVAANSSPLSSFSPSASKSSKSQSPTTIAKEDRRRCLSFCNCPK